MQRRLADLEKECSDLGLKPKEFTGRGGKPAKRDYVNALGDFHQQRSFGLSPPWGLSKRREMRSPMLAFLFSSLKEEEQRKVMSSPDWAFEKKIDGVRMTLFWNENGDFEAYSRNTSVENYMPVAYHEKLILPDLPPELQGRSIVLDCEIQCTSAHIETLASKGIPTETVLQATSALLALNTSESLELQKQVLITKHALYTPCKVLFSSH